jgi:hypothetical protein
VSEAEQSVWVRLGDGTLAVDKGTVNFYIGRLRARGRRVSFVSVRDGLQAKGIEWHSRWGP